MGFKLQFLNSSSKKKMKKSDFGIFFEINNQRSCLKGDKKIFLSQKKIVKWKKNNYN